MAVFLKSFLERFRGIFLGLRILENPLFCASCQWDSYDQVR